MDHEEESSIDLSFQILFPELIKQSIKNYVENGSRMGSFLTSLFSNDLFSTYAKADAENLKLIPLYIHYIHWNLPSNCHGSYEIVEKWIKERSKI